MKKWIVTAHRTPTNFNDPESWIVEAETEDDAKQVIKLQLRDLDNHRTLYVYRCREYDLPEVKGRVLGTV